MVIIIKSNAIMSPSATTATTHGGEGSQASSGDSVQSTIMTLESGKRRKFSFLRNRLPSLANEKQISSKETSISNNNNNEPQEIAEVLKNTKIIAGLELTRKEIPNPPTPAQNRILKDDPLNVVDDGPTGRFCASALKNTYLEEMCGDVHQSITYEEADARFNVMPDDPTVEEYVECYIAANKRECLPNLNVEQGEEDMSYRTKNNKNDFKNLISPSSLQQSIFKNRSISGLPSRLQQEARMQAPSSQAKHTEDLPISLSNRSDATLEAEAHRTAATTTTTATQSTKPCSCRCQRTPILPPEYWPQRPLLLRPTPNSGMRIKGIRFAGQNEYIWKASQSALTWSSALQRHWGKTESSAPVEFPMCEQCMIVPINNGRELPGESLVVDFESNVFKGTMLVRVKDTHGTTCEQFENLKGYFDGLHRRYQVVMRGRFKHAIPWTECLAGIQLESPCGKLPAKWIVKGALNVISFFAPQLQACVDCDRPYSLTPLGSTPQSLTVRSEDDPNPETIKSGAHLEEEHEEPLDPNLTLLGHASCSKSAMQRARYRKKNFDKLYAMRSNTPMTDPNKVYTFEFLQHLLEFESFSIELGSMVGSIHLKSVLNGQPLQIMASHGLPVPNKPDVTSNRIWSFDLYHEMLIPDAKQVEGLS